MAASSSRMMAVSVGPGSSSSMAGSSRLPRPSPLLASSSSNMGAAAVEWRLVETLRLLELFVADNDQLSAAGAAGQQAWEQRAKTMGRELGAKRPQGFFTARSLRDELNRVFSRPNPEHVTLGLPSHARSREAAEMWIVHYRKEVEKERETRRHAFWISARHMFDIVQRYKRDEITEEELNALRDEMRERDALRPDAVEHEERIKKLMAETPIEEVTKINSLQDLVNTLKTDRGGVVADGAQSTPILSPKRPSRSPDKAIRSPVIGSPLPAIRPQQPNTIPQYAVAAVGQATDAPSTPTATPSILVKAATPPTVPCAMMSVGLEAEDFESPEQVFGAHPAATVDDKTPPTLHVDEEREVLVVKTPRGRARRVVAVEQTAPTPAPAARKRRRQDSSPTVEPTASSSSTPTADQPAPKRSKRLLKEDPTDDQSTPLGIEIPPTAAKTTTDGAKKPSPSGSTGVVKIISPRRLSSQHSPPTLSVAVAAGGGEEDGGEPAAATTTTRRGRGRGRKREPVEEPGQDEGGVEEYVGPRPKPVEMLKVTDEARMEQPDDWDKEEDEIDEELERALWWREKSSVTGLLTVGTQTNVSIQHEIATTDSSPIAAKGRGRGGRPKRQKSPSEREFTSSAAQTARVEFGDDDVVVMQSIGRNTAHRSPAGWKPRPANKATLAEIETENRAALSAAKTEEPKMALSAKAARPQTSRGAGGRSRRTRESSTASSEVNSSSVATEEREQEEPDQFVKVLYLPKLRLTSTTTTTTTVQAPTSERIGRGRGGVPARHRSSEDTLTSVGNYSSWEAVPKQLLVGVWKEIAGHKHANVFMHPVSDEAVPGYYTTVHRPMTLTQVKRMIDSGAIRTFGKMTDVVAQMCSNAVVFNPETHDVNHYAKVLLQHSLKSIRDVQRPAEHTGSRHTAGIATAQLLAGSKRGRRSTVAHGGLLGKLEVQIHPASVGGGSSQHSDSLPTDSITTPSIKADSPSPHVFTPPVAPAGRRKRKMAAEGDQDNDDDAVKAKRGRRSAKAEETLPQASTSTTVEPPHRRRGEPSSSAAGTGRSSLRRVESVMEARPGRGGRRRGGEKAMKARRSD